MVKLLSPTTFITSWNLGAGFAILPESTFSCIFTQEIAVSVQPKDNSPLVCNLLLEALCTNVSN